MPFPTIIQGGMGIAVSDWRLARAVSLAGQLGVVSGTALDAVLARRLQLGDADGSLRRAMQAFPIPGVAERVAHRYFVEGGMDPSERFRQVPMPKVRPSRFGQELLAVANFVEVWLAKEGHGNPVGINYLEKIQAPTLPSLYGAMLAGVDYVLMGAGIPRAIPRILDALAAGQPASMTIDIKGGSGELEFDPNAFAGGVSRPVERPMFLAIVSSHVLGTILATRTDPPVDGFVIEYPTAGGHNAPPRAKGALSESGEPVYGERDIPDLAVFRDLGLPFWLAGSYGSAEGLERARSEGAIGVQVGTAFAYCDESGLRDDLKRLVLDASRRRETEVFTDPIASPTGFPFKVVDIPQSLSDDAVYGERTRVCDLGYLRSAYIDDDGRQGWRCPSEPVDDYVRKGGHPDDTIDRRCLCNALMANVGLGQRQRGDAAELPLLTSGDEVHHIAAFLAEDATTYNAADVIGALLS